MTVSPGVGPATWAAPPRAVARSVIDRGVKGWGSPWGMATLALGRFLQDQLGHKRGLGGRP